MLDGVRRAIGADTLGYISQQGMIAATEQPASRLCSACFDGNYPIELPGRDRAGQERHRAHAGHRRPHWHPASGRQRQRLGAAQALSLPGSPGPNYCAAVGLSASDAVGRLRRCRPASAMHALRRGSRSGHRPEAGMTASMSCSCHHRVALQRFDQRPGKPDGIGVTSPTHQLAIVGVRNGMAMMSRRRSPATSA